MIIDFKYLEDNKYASVTDLARALVKENNISDKIEVYRGDMLCLTVTDVQEAAKIEPTGSGWAAYRLPEVRRRFKRPPTGATAI